MGVPQVIGSVGVDLTIGTVGVEVEIARVGIEREIGSIILPVEREIGTVALERVIGTIVVLAIRRLIGIVGVEREVGSVLVGIEIGTVKTQRTLIGKVYPEFPIGSVETPYSGIVVTPGRLDDVDVGDDYIITATLPQVANASEYAFVWDGVVSYGASVENRIYNPAAFRYFVRGPVLRFRVTRSQGFVSAEVRAAHPAGGREVFYGILNLRWGFASEGELVIGSVDI